MANSVPSPFETSQPHAGVEHGISEASDPPDGPPSASLSSASAAGGGGGGGHWSTAANVFKGIQVAAKFDTLRDMVGPEAYVSQANLRNIRPLGRGAFAEVTLAALPPEGKEGEERRVAVKTLHKNLLEDPDEVALFLKEVKLLRKLKHRWVQGRVLARWGCRGPRTQVGAGRILGNRRGLQEGLQRRLVHRWRLARRWLLARQGHNPGGASYSRGTAGGPALWGHLSVCWPPALCGCLEREREVASLGFSCAGVGPMCRPHRLLLAYKA